MSDGQCLRNAYREMCNREERGENVVYVQGTVNNPLTGKRFLHAWVETKTHVIDPTIDLTLPKKEYYARLVPRNTIRTDPFTTAMLITKGFHFFTRNEVDATESKIRELEKIRKLGAGIKSKASMHIKEQGALWRKKHANSKN